MDAVLPIVRAKDAHIQTDAQSRRPDQDRGQSESDRSAVFNPFHRLVIPPRRTKLSVGMPWFFIELVDRGRRCLEVGRRPRFFHTCISLAEGGPPPRVTSLLAGRAVSGRFTSTAGRHRGGYSPRRGRKTAGWPWVFTRLVASRKFRNGMRPRKLVGHDVCELRVLEETRP